MSETRLVEAIEALLTMWSGNLGITDVDVRDGDVVTGDTSDALYVGYDADSEAEHHAASVTQDWASLGKRTRDESIDIVCSIVAHSPDETPKGARDRAFAILTAAGALLRGNPSLSLPPPTTASLITNEFYCLPTNTGIWARLVFTVNVRTRV